MPSKPAATQADKAKSSRGHSALAKLKATSSLRRQVSASKGLGHLAIANHKADSADNLTLATIMTAFSFKLQQLQDSAEERQLSTLMDVNGQEEKIREQAKVDCKATGNLIDEADALLESLNEQAAAKAKQVKLTLNSRMGQMRSILKTQKARLDEERKQMQLRIGTLRAKCM